MLEMANQLSEDEEYSHALKFYKSILQIEPTNIGVIIDYGVTLQNLGLYHQALTMYDQVLKLQPKKNKRTILNITLFKKLHTQQCSLSVQELR